MITDSKPWHKQFWPWFLIALPAAVVIACFYTVYLALNNPLSIVKEDYYKEGLSINQNLQRYLRATELGIAAHCLLVEQRMQCEFVSGAEALGDKALQLQFMHPVNSDKDFQLSLTAISPSVYTSDLLLPARLEILRRESRWYIYLESMEGSWALQTESAVHEQQVIVLGRVGD